jgi:SSS family solute:Na+ symporter
MIAAASFGTVNYIILFAYLAAMFAIGLYLSGKQKTTEDYFLAGRRMPWFIVAMSIFSSLVSAISYIGVPGTIYEENASLIIGTLMSVVVAPVLIIVFYPFYRRLNVTTSYEYIFHRYGMGARYSVSGLFILARLGWLGAVIYAPSLALSTVTGVNIWLAICLMGLLATLYTMLGGLSAVLWTDAVQFVILIGGAIWVAISLVNNIPGGVAQIMSVAQEAGKLDMGTWKLSLFKMTGFGLAISYFLQLMQDYGTDQVTVQRLMATKNFSGMAKAAIVNSFFDVLGVGLLIFLGLGLYVYYQGLGGTLPEEIFEHKDRIFPYYIVSALPTGISGLIITAIFAAAMSSMDSGINSLSTVIVNDFVRPLRKKVRSERDDVKLARILTVVLGVLAVAAACLATTLESVLKAASTYLSLFAGPILAIFLLGILTRRANFRGWLTGAIVSFAVTLWVQKAEFNGQEVHYFYYFPISFGVCVVVGYIASLLFGGPKAPVELTLAGRSKLTAQGVSSSENE